LGFLSSSESESEEIFLIGFFLVGLDTFFLSSLSDSEEESTFFTIFFGTAFLFLSSESDESEEIFQIGFPAGF